MQFMSDLSRPAGWRRPPHRDDVPRAWEREHGTGGVYRRSIVLVNTPGMTWGELEDDFHHFRIEVDHDGEVATDARGLAIRGPWQSCFDSPDAIRAAIGMRVGGTSTSIGRHTRARDNCTHLFDVTGLAVAHVGRVEPQRRYDIECTERSADDTFVARLVRDGEEVLEWHVEGLDIAAPEEWVGAPLRSGFIRWAEERLEPELAEAAIALRRVLDISMGRLKDLDELNEAAEVGGVMAGKCYTYTPEIRLGSLRMRGSAKDFTDHSDRVLGHLDDPQESR